MNMLTGKEQISIINFISMCESLGAGDNAGLELKNMEVSVWRDKEVSGLYDVHTYENGALVDDTCGVHIEELDEIVCGSFGKTRKFKLA
jgi:hypothetical protein